MRLILSGEDRSRNLKRPSVDIKDIVNAPSTCSFTWKDTGLEYAPVLPGPSYTRVRADWRMPWPGESVEIRDDDGSVLFSGSVDEPRGKHIKVNDAGVLQGAIECVDHHYILGRHIVAETYPAGTLAGDIIRHIVSEYLTEDGITEGVIQDGPAVEGGVVFAYLQAQTCIDELGTRTGYLWRINADKSLDFFERATYDAPWDVVEGAPYMQPQVRSDRREYRNRQYVRAGRDISLPQTRSFRGDGETQVWAVDLPIARVPTIIVDGAPQTVGIRGLETDKQFYWQKDDKSINQDENETPLTDEQVLSIEYQGFYPLLVAAEDPDAVDERKSVEGGSGVYEAIEDKTDIEDRDSAIEYARGLLQKYARIQKTLIYETYRGDLRPGMLQYVNLPEYGLDGECLISEINTYEDGRADGVPRRRVTVLDGQDVGGWRRFYQMLLNARRTFAIRENEILLRLATAKSVVGLEDDVETTVHDYLAAAPHLAAGVFKI